MISWDLWMGPSVLRCFCCQEGSSQVGGAGWKSCAHQLEECGPGLEGASVLETQMAGPRTRKLRLLGLLGAG